jgi:hypothetical protein
MIPNLEVIQDHDARRWDADMWDMLLRTDDTRIRAALAPDSLERLDVVAVVDEAPPFFRLQVPPCPAST